MSNNGKRICWGICLAAMFLVSGCSLISEKSVPESEAYDSAFQTETMTHKAGTDAVPEPSVPEEPEVSKATDEKKFVTDKQIEARLFPGTQPGQAGQKTVTKIQRPVRLNQSRTDGNTSPGNIILNFDEADLNEVIRAIAEILKLNYVIETQIAGNVTVHTAGGLNPEEVFSVFFQLLEANGLTAVKAEGLYRIVRMEGASRLPMNIHLRSDMSDVSAGERIIIQIISLEHIDVQEMVKILQPVMSEQGTIISHANSNTLLLIDKGIIVLKALNLVKVFDVDTFKLKNHRIYQVKFTDVEETVSLIESLRQAYGETDKKLSLIPIKKLNAFIGVSPEPAALKWVADILGQVDVPGYDASPKIYVYKVQNGTCDELSSILTSVFSNAAASATSEKSSKSESAKIQNTKKDQPDTETINRLLKGGSSKTAAADASGSGTTAKGLPGPEGSTGSESAPAMLVTRPGASGDTAGADTLKGTIKITTDTVRNALIVEAYPSDYQVVTKILEQLDVLPRQVLIEVTIADITLTDTNELGIDWTKYLSSQGMGGDVSGTIGSSGLNFTIGLTDKWQAALSAMASENRVNILSTPVILATDNIEASIDVAEEIPVVSTSYTTVTDGNNVVTNTVQYRETGILLTVTPHINDEGFVTMEISQEVSETGDPVEAGGETYQSFSSRNIDTTFTVSHQQTIMIGGLIRQSDTGNSSGLPFLYKIPGLKWLFGSDSVTTAKTELAVFITPYVIYSMEDVAEITREFRQRTNKARGENSLKGTSN